MKLKCPIFVHNFFYRLALREENPYSYDADSAWGSTPTIINYDMSTKKLEL